VTDAYTRLNAAADDLLSRPHATARQLKRLERRFFHAGFPVPVDLTARLLALGAPPHYRNR